MNPREECTGYDLAMGAATGIRVWRVDPLGRLTGWSYPKVWTPGENTAECGRRRRTEECTRGECGRYHGGTWGGLPDPCTEPDPCGGDSPDCGCGFWAYHDGVTQFGDGSGVVGIVEGYGKTTVGTKGFRSQKARIVALAFPKPDPSAGRRRQRAARWNLAIAIINIAAVLSQVRAAVGEGFDNPWRLFALFNLAAAVWFLHLYRQARKHDRDPLALIPLPRFHQPSEVEARVRRNYPDVEFYDSVSAMKAAHPLDPLLEPTPENDPDFWTRSVQSSEASGATVTLTVNTSQFTEAVRKAQRQLEQGFARGGAIGRRRRS